MALKFLNKKGWHTGSLRNIENVWKAEQKHAAEQKKLEELKKQIQDERAAQELRLLQEQAGLVPKQERLEFLYDSGLAVGRSSTDEYLLGKPVDAKEGESDAAKAAAAPGALFVEEKPQSANDKWRKIHSDPLLLIRQQEQAALARIKDNPVKMGMIKKSVQEKLAKKEKKHKVKKERKKRKKRESDSSEDDNADTRNRGQETERIRESARHWEDRDTLKSTKRKYNPSKKLDDDIDELARSRRSPVYATDVSKSSKHDSSIHKRKHDNSYESRKPETDFANKSSGLSSELSKQNEVKQTSKYQAGKLSEEEKAARLKEMQINAEVHEEQRWHRLKKASDADARELARNAFSSGKTFLDETARNIYGTKKGESASVEESVRRRTHFIERSIGDRNVNTFQRS